MEKVIFFDPSDSPFNMYSKAGNSLCLLNILRGNCP